MSRRTSAQRTDPDLWEAVKSDVLAGSRGGKPGQWSARKAQLAVAEYKAAGGGYIGPKRADNSLAAWTAQDWTTRSGRPSLETGERYLPRAAIEALTPGEYAATTRAKRAGMKQGKQFVAQPRNIAAKVAEYRQNGGMRPFFPFFGAKWRHASHLAPPRYDTIIEPFAGSAGYSTRWGAGKQVLLVEIDPVICDVWRFLISATPAKIRRLPDIPADSSVDDFNLDPGEAGLIGFWLNRGSAAPAKSPSKWMRSGVNPESTWWGPSVRERIIGQLDGISRWGIAEANYADSPDLEATWIVDPPYQAAGRSYKYGSDAIDFDALGEWCQSLAGQVVVCENEGADWLPFESFQTMKANCSAGEGRCNESKEVIWTNE